MELNNEFKCVVDINAQPVELFFRLVHVPKGCKYFVRARTFKGVESSFEVVADSQQQWQVVPPMPIWLSILESQIADIVAKKASESN